MASWYVNSSFPDVSHEGGGDAAAGVGVFLELFMLFLSCRSIGTAIIA